jgi:effector-binding domain-containing protein
MAYEVSVVEEPGRKLIAVERHAKLSGLGPVFMESFDTVYAHLKAHNVTNTGHNVGLYRNAQMEGSDMSFDCVIGVEVSADVPAGDGIGMHQTPAGPAATAVYWGDYSDMHEVHEAIQQWCDANGREYGENWEVYGDFTEDPAKRRTDVFYELKT